MVCDADRRLVCRDRVLYGLRRRTVKKRDEDKVRVVELEAGFVILGLAMLTKAILAGGGRSS